MAQSYSTYISSNIGEMNKVVTLLKRITVKDSAGAPAYVWHPFATVPAMIEPVSGREYWSAAQSNREATVRVTIRYMDGIEDSMRVLYKANDRLKVYEMTSLPINGKEGCEFLQLMCNEIENDFCGLR